MNVGLSQHHACVIEHVAGGKIIAAVHDQIEAGKNLADVLRGESLLKWNHLYIRIERIDRLFGAFGLRHPGAIQGVNHLALKVAQIHHVHVDDPKGAHSCCGQIESRR